MRLRNIPWAQDMLDDYPQYVPVKLDQLKGHWHEEFKNKQPIYLEVGSGKGQFIYTMAQTYPQINFIAMELQTSVAVRILEKLVAQPLSNLRLINQDGGEISDFFAPGEIARIYLNFSDPWPKKRHAKRRLTSTHFLDQYEQVLQADGEIHFKTDNQGLFEYSLASMSQYGMAFKQVWLDLHQSDYPNNIMTEYEEKFSAKGHPIYRLEAYYPRKEASNK